MKDLLKSILILLLCGAALLSADPILAGDPDSDYQAAREYYQELLNSAKRQLYRENWERAIDRLQTFRQRYPDHPRAPDALFLAGKARAGLYNVSRVAGDARQAVADLVLVPDSYPRDSLGDDALFLAGELLLDPLNQPAEAYQVFARITRDHPGGDMSGKARMKLAALVAFAPAPVVSGSPQAASGATTLKEIRVWSEEGYTRVVLDLSQRVEFKSHYLPEDAAERAPARLYLDLKGTEPAKALPGSLRVDNGILEQVRTGQPAPDVLRIVFDLGTAEDYKVFSLEEPARIVVDLAGKLRTDVAGTPEIKALPPSGDNIGQILGRSVPSPDELRVAIPDRSPGAGLRRIVIDPGHGGKDPGAIGPRGTMEKDITLAIARVLAQKLKAELGCEVIMTRDRDVYLSLQERTALANRVDADLFISIHVNASTNSSAYGIETYYLNFSKNDQAVAVAARENGTTLKEVGDLELILFDLMANSKINESSRLAAEVQRSLVEHLQRRYSDVKDLGVRGGPFHVLLNATMPSVLVETAFVSNRREEKRLLSPEYHRHAAEAILAGVRSYAKTFKLIAAK